MTVSSADAQTAPAPSVADTATAHGAASDSGTTVRGGLAWTNNQIVLTSNDGNVTISPVVRIDADAISFFGQNRDGGYRSGTEWRRNRYGFRGTILQDIDYNFTWEFGAKPAASDTLFELDARWNALRWASFRIGAFPLIEIPEFASSTYDLLFLERAAISSIAASVASGDTREAVGVEARGDDWNAAFYVSGGVASTHNTSKERGLVARAVYLAVDGPGLQFQFGFDGSDQLAPGFVDRPSAISFADFPELRGVTSLRFLNTGSIPASNAYAIGPEAEARLGPVYLEAFYQHLGVQVTGDGNRSFDGWYVQGAVPLLGPPRERLRATGTWARPKTDGWIDPFAGNWGALEAVARYSTVNLNDAPTNGGRQSIWSVGANWYLSTNLKIQAEYEIGSVHLDSGPRNFQGVGFRASFNL
ncbi:MAG TPA: porin [Acetobacteraceae bacterium]|nr:porin [Acetobacteraceae bacterium]